MFEGAGFLGTLYVQLAADSARLVTGMRTAQTTMQSGSALMLRQAALLSAGVTGALSLIGAAAVREAIRFESSFAGVRKTVNATEAEFEAMAASFRQMAREMPINVNEINKVAEAAGQLGIRKEDILSFTKVMIDMGKSTNLASDVAATELAKLANITSMSKKNFDRLGSTIVELGNNMATTEADIVSMAMRIAGAGTQVGLTVPQIMSFAAALSSVGIEAEAGGTAMSQSMVKMAQAVAMGGEELEVFARTANLTVEEFSKLFREDAASAVLEFMKGFKRISDEGGNVF